MFGETQELIADGRMVQRSRLMQHVVKQRRRVWHLECGVDADKKAWRRNEGFLGAELNAFNLPRNFAQLGQWKYFQIDLPAGRLGEFLFHPLSGFVLGIMNCRKSCFHDVGLCQTDGR